MKNVMTFTLMMLVVITGMAQNPFCKAFGTSYADVLDFLQTKYNTNFEADYDLITAKTPGFSIEYHFVSGKLDKTVMYSSFNDKKGALESMEAFKIYYERSSAEILENDLDRNTTGFMAYMNTTQSEVVLSHTANKSFELRISSELNSSHIPVVQNLMVSNDK